MSNSWYPVGGSGGLPSDILTSQKEHHRRLKTSDDALKTGYGESLFAENDHIIQVSAEYGFSLGILTFNLGGTTTAENGLFKASTGTGTENVSAIVSSRALRQRAGQGISCIFSAMFSQGVADSGQKAGFISSESDFSFGYFNDVFGVFYSKNGRLETQILTVSSGAGGAETATVTVDGVDHSIGLTSGTAELNAFEISEYLKTADPRYNFSSNGDTVIALAGLPYFGAGSFAFSSATASASWVQITNGAPVADQVFIPKSEWNVNNFIDIDPTKLNKYRIQFDGNINYFIQDPDTGAFELVHVLKYLNKFDTPVVENPVFRVGWAASNLGNTSDISLYGDEAAGMIEGKIKYNQIPTSVSNSISVDTARKNILSFRNRLLFDSKTNRAEIIPLILSIGSDFGKPLTLEIVANPTVADGDVLEWEYLDESTSLMEVSKNDVIITDGIVVQTFVIFDTKDIPIGEYISYHLPGDEFSITITAPSSSNNITTCAASWIEDK